MYWSLHINSEMIFENTRQNITLNYMRFSSFLIYLSGLYFTRNKMNCNLSFSEEKSLLRGTWEQISTSSICSRLWGKTTTSEIQNVWISITARLWHISLHYCSVITFHVSCTQFFLKNLDCAFSVPWSCHSTKMRPHS